jgi:hypothetical protein
MESGPPIPGALGLAIILVPTTGEGTRGDWCTFRGEEPSPIAQFDIEQSAAGTVGRLYAIAAGLVCWVVILIVAAVTARYMQDETAQLPTFDPGRGPHLSLGDDVSSRCARGSVHPRLSSFPTFAS